MEILLRPWRDDDLPLLVAANTAEMTRYLGGVETEDAVRARHEKYLRLATVEEAGIRAIELDGTAVGGINWWPSEWEGNPVTEIGWFVVPGAQGRGVAARATRMAIDDARRRARHRTLVAFPAVENEPSNRVCAAAGFASRGVADFPYRDTMLRATVWELDLDAAP